MKRPALGLCGPALAGVATALVLVGTVPAHPASSITTANGTPMTSATASPPLVQLSPCAGTDDQGHTQTGPLTGGGTQVTFHIPSSTVAKVDGNGIITAVSTNTGCVPDASNQFYALTPDGSCHPADPAQVEQLLSASYSGDWTTPGQFHPFG